MEITEIEQESQRMQADIIQMSGIHPSECACETCQSMCRKTPCVGTPLEMYLIGEHPEFANKLALTMSLASLQLGLPPMVVSAPIFNETEKCCSFFVGGKCQLHEKGLKPLEGKLANCRPDTKLINATLMIYQSWLPLQKRLITQFFK